LPRQAPIQQPVHHLTLSVQAPDLDGLGLNALYQRLFMDEEVVLGEGGGGMMGEIIYGTLGFFSTMLQSMCTYLPLEVFSRQNPGQANFA